RCRLGEGTGARMGPSPGLDAALLLKSVTTSLSSRGFELFSPLTERHGSWEITYHRVVENIDRTVSLAFTAEFPPVVNSAEQPWLVEIWIGAEQTTRFFRRMVRQFSAAGFQLNGEAFLNQLMPALQQSIDQVSGLKTEDLLANYPSRRHKLRERHIDASDINLSQKPEKNPSEW